MNRLTRDETLFYLRPKNRSTGVDAITEEDLEKIDLDAIRNVVRKGDRIFSAEGKQLYELDRFTPRSRSYAFKPSFAGSQVILGKEGRKLHISNGRWFASSL